MLNKSIQISFCLLDFAIAALLSLLIIFLLSFILMLIKIKINVLPLNFTNYLHSQACSLKHWDFVTFELCLLISVSIFFFLSKFMFTNNNNSCNNRGERSSVIKLKLAFLNECVCVCVYFSSHLVSNKTYVSLSTQINNKMLYSSLLPNGHELFKKLDWHNDKKERKKEKCEWFPLPTCDWMNEWMHRKMKICIKYKLVGCLSEFLNDFWTNLCFSSLWNHDDHSISLYLALLFENMHRKKKNRLIGSI